MNPHNQNTPKINNQYMNQDLLNAMYNSQQPNQQNMMYTPYYNNIQSQMMKKWQMYQYMMMRSQNPNIYSNHPGTQRMEFRNPNQFNQYRNSFPQNRVYVNSPYPPTPPTMPLNYYNPNPNSQMPVPTTTECTVIPSKQTTSNMKPKIIHKFDPNSAPLVIQEKKKEKVKEIQMIIISDSEESVKECEVPKQPIIIPPPTEKIVVTPPPPVQIPPTVVVNIEKPQIQPPPPPVIVQVQNQKPVVPKKVIKENATTKKINKPPNQTQKKASTKQQPTKPQNQQAAKNQPKEKIVNKVKKITKKLKTQSQKEKQKEKDKPWREKRISQQQKNNVPKYTDTPGKIRLGQLFQAVLPDFVLNTKIYSEQRKTKILDLTQRRAWNGVEKLKIYNKLKQLNKQLFPQALIELANQYKQISKPEIVDQTIKQNTKAMILESNYIQNEKQRQMQIQEGPQKTQTMSIQTRITRQNLRKQLT